MFDHPIDEWSEIWLSLDLGPANSTGTYILTVLGCILMVTSLIGFVMMESRKIDVQTSRLRDRYDAHRSETPFTHEAPFPLEAPFTEED